MAKSASTSDSTDTASVFTQGVVQKVLKASQAMPRAIISGTTVNQTESGTAIILAGPLLSVSIQQTADAQVSRLLSGTLAVSTFGQLPVTITLSGIDYAWLLDDIRFSKCSNTAGICIQKFYRDYSIAFVQNIEKRLIIQLPAGKYTTTYTAVLISQDVAYQSRIGTGQSGQQGVGYKLKLIGVRNNG